MSQSPPFSPQRFADVEAHMRALVDADALPHAHFVAERDGEVLHEFCFGKAREDGRPLQHDAIYRIASMTKAVTAVAFLMLVEEGRVALDDPVAKVLPELADLPVYVSGTVPPFVTRPALRQPRMIDLLLHTSGFTVGFQKDSAVAQDYWKAGIYNFKAVLHREQMLADLAGMPLVHDPGAHFTYSIATDLLGLIAERLTDRSLGEVFADRIFAPLGMMDTGFALKPEAMSRFTDAWVDHSKYGVSVYDAAEDSLWSRPLTFESGGGGLLSTMADYHRFCRMLRDGGEGVLKPETVAAMTRNHLPGGQSIGEMSGSMFGGGRYRGVGHGLGIAVTLPNGLSERPAGEFHWAGIFLTWYSVVPSERLILILMTQRLALVEDRLPERVYDMLLR